MAVHQVLAVVAVVEIGMLESAVLSFVFAGGIQKSKNNNVALLVLRAHATRTFRALHLVHPPVEATTAVTTVVVGLAVRVPAVSVTLEPVV